MILTFTLCILLDMPSLTWKYDIYCFRVKNVISLNVAKFKIQGFKYTVFPAMRTVSFKKPLKQTDIFKHWFIIACILTNLKLICQLWFMTCIVYFYPLTTGPVVKENQWQQFSWKGNSISLIIVWDDLIRKLSEQSWDQ